jgi:hypothetical protein
MMTLLFTVFRPPRDLGKFKNSDSSVFFCWKVEGNPPPDFLVWVAFHDAAAAESAHRSELPLTPSVIHHLQPTFGTT